MAETDLKLLRVIVRREYGSLTGRNDYEDCYQGIVANILAGKHKGAKPRFMVIDWLRANQFDGRRDKNHVRRNLYFAKNLDKLSGNMKADSIIEFDSFNSFIKILKKEDERVVAKLYFKWEFTMLEIADLMERTEMRICQILKSVKQQVKKKIKDGKITNLTRGGI